MRITKKQMTDTLNKAKWDVRKDKTMVFMADTDNPAYWEEQAKILIREAHEQRMAGGAEQYTDRLLRSIQLLTLAIIAHEQGHGTSKA